jgi:hypothetical protein
MVVEALRTIMLGIAILTQDFVAVTGVIVVQNDARPHLLPHPIRHCFLTVRIHLQNPPTSRPLTKNRKPLYGTSVPLKKFSLVINSARKF